MVAGRETLRNHGRTNNSPATASYPELGLLPFDDGGGNGGRGTSRVCLCRLARIFGKFLANDFLRVTAAGDTIANDRINTGDLWWAWVDLNHRPRPYQGSVVRFYNNL